MVKKGTAPMNIWWLPFPMHMSVQNALKILLLLSTGLLVEIYFYDIFDKGSNPIRNP